MKSAPQHKDESKRLESLDSIDILDSLPEESYNQIVFLASQICGTPIALISLVDKDRQWFKAKVGLSASETPRNIAFCAHAILQDDVFIVENSAQDERFHDNPLVTGSPNVQFYAGAPLLSPDGYPIGTVCVIDSKARTLSENQIAALKALSAQVTQLLELKTTIHHLKKSEEKLIFKSTGVENITEGIVLQDQTGAIIDFNPAALKVLELTEDQLTGKKSIDPHWKAVKEDGSDFPGQDHPAMVCLRTGKKQTDVIMGVYNNSEKAKWIKINSVPLFNDNDQTQPKYAVTSFADITQFKKLENERHHLEAQLIESARLSALGEMASGIAHEINNPLTIIRSKVSILKTRLNTNKLTIESASTEFDKIDSTIDRIVKIIQGLRTHSRNANNDPFIETPVYSVINDTLELCKEKFNYNSVTIKVNCPPDLTFECRAAQISQILMNLLTNAFDAINTLNEKWIEINVSDDTHNIIFCVTDSGHGIESKIAKKIMQPFYTTKEFGKGTGLGLSISNSLAKAHNGYLQYIPHSKNTTFMLTLPKIHIHNQQQAA